MIVIGTGQADAKSFDAQLLFATQMSRRGHSVGIDEKLIPTDIDRNQKFEAVPFVTDLSKAQMSGLIVIGGESISDDLLMAIRRYDLADDIAVSVTGRFANDQSQISASNKLAYALGREVNVVNLNELQPNQILDAAISPLSCDIRQNTAAPATAKPSLFLFVPPDILEEPLTLPALGSMNNLSDFRLSIVSTGLGKAFVRNSQFANLPVFGLAELSPMTLSELADVVVFYGEGVPGERMASFALGVLGASGVVLDCTASAAFSSSGAPVLRGPTGFSELRNYLENVVLPNRVELGRQSVGNEWIIAHSTDRLEAALGLPVGQKSPPHKGDQKTIFMPTNGVGLGHAQRCSLIAAEFEAPRNVAFAAFPSCIDLISRNGFPCVPLVQKSPEHLDGYSNDLVNYLRLRRSVSHGDRLVFDGGYVFDSVFRAIVENSLDATWIRRGLWRAEQVRDIAFDREKHFQKIIIPAEAFAELNETYTFGPKNHAVGPIVQKTDWKTKDRGLLRAKLAKLLSHKFDKLVVTMLGGGVASDRAAHLQNVCALLEPRPNCLHLVVVWPGSRVMPGLFGWKNTKVVKSMNALSLCLASDLVISAAGYNSFHEILYHAIPAIFIPQTAPYLDDQEKRARAASDRGLAATVLEHEFIQLEREVSAFLDSDKARKVRGQLIEQDLPARGNSDAAKLIEKGHPG